MNRDPLENLGEDWLAANDPNYRRSRDLDHKSRLVGLLPQVEAVVYPQDKLRGGRLVEHHLERAPRRLCSVCSQPFAPRESAHRTCGEPCRLEARREYQRDLMRERRKAERYAKAAKVLLAHPSRVAAADQCAAEHGVRVELRYDCPRNMAYLVTADFLAKLQGSGPR